MINKHYAENIVEGLEDSLEKSDIDNLYYLMELADRAFRKEIPEISECLEETIGYSGTIFRNAQIMVDLININLENQEVLSYEIKEFEIDDSVFNELITKSFELYKDSKIELATQQLWDAFERIKTYDKQLEKKESADNLVILMSKGNADYKTILDAEFGSLTSIGNRFRIRHHETFITDIICKEHYDYLFHRCLALLRLATKAVRENNFEAFAGYVTSIGEKQDEIGKKTLYQIVNYFQNNWDSAVERMKGTYCGSCTEPLISHTLSERLSRNPLAWSKEGLAKMAMLRVFTENGGKVTAEQIRISRSKTDRSKDFCALKNGLEIYNKYAEAQVKSVFGGKHDWSFFEKSSTPAAFSYGKLTGTTILLKACAKLRAV